MVDIPTIREAGDAAIPKVSTGISGLDEILYGGLPQGDTVPDSDSTGAKGHGCGHTARPGPCASRVAPAGG